MTNIEGSGMLDVMPLRSPSPSSRGRWPGGLWRLGHRRNCGWHSSRGRWQQELFLTTSNFNRLSLPGSIRDFGILLTHGNLAMAARLCRSDGNCCMPPSLWIRANNWIAYDKKKVKNGRKLRCMNWGKSPDCTQWATEKGSKCYRCFINSPD